MNKSITLLLGLALAAAATAPAAAQVSRTLTVGFDNPAVMSLDINRNTVSFKLAPNFTAEPKELPEALVIVVRSNVPWVLTATVTSDFRSLESTANMIPSDRMEFRCRQTIAADAVAMQEQYQQLIKNQAAFVARGNATADQGVSISTDYRLRIGMQDPAGTYTLPITYTLSPAQ